MLSDLVRTPISDVSPCGVDVRYDEDFERLKAEIGKRAAVSARTDFDALVQKGKTLLSGKPGGDGDSTLLAENGAPDYDGVIDLATRILTMKSKNFEVAAYLCMGLLRARAYEGLAEGLEAFLHLVESYWEGGYPERLEGRRRVFEMLAERLGEIVADRPAAAAERDALGRAIEASRTIDALLREKMPDGPPSLSKLLSALNEVRDSLPAAAPAPSVSSQAPAPAASAPSAPSPVIPSSAAPPSEEEAQRAVARSAAYLRSESPRSALGYRLLRCVRWDSIEQIPPLEGGRTLMSGPPEHFRLQLDSARSARNWPDVVATCEDIFYESPCHYWLDLARYEDQALLALGAEYGPVRRALIRELAGLLERMPGLVSLSFEDGTSFADAATREWIDQEVRAGARDAAATPVSRALAPSEDAVAAQLAEAERRAKEGDLAGALETLQTAQMTDARPRARFARQILMARLCLAHDKAHLARPLLEELGALCPSADLKDWEPETCYEIWSLLHRCYQSLVSSSHSPVKEDYASKMERIFDQMCRLDIRLAASDGGRT